MLAFLTPNWYTRRMDVPTICAGSCEGGVKEAGEQVVPVKALNLATMSSMSGPVGLKPCATRASWI